MLARRSRFWLILLAAASATLGAAILSAADSGAKSAAVAMLFHKVYAPADRIDEWPRGSVRYVPMDRAEFERIVAEMADEATSPANREGRVEAATYSARLGADGVLRGRGELKVHHASSRGVLLDLGKCDLAIDNATWEDANDAVLGIGADGRLKLLVERPGTLRFDFTVESESIDGRNVVSVAIPSGISTQCLLDAPSEIVPNVSIGLIAPVDASTDANAKEDVDKNRRTWRIDLGNAGRLAFSLGARRPSREHVLVSQYATDYTIAPSGLSFASTFHLDVYQTPLERMTLRMDADATLVDARIGDRAARIVDRKVDEDGVQLIELEVPTPILGVGQSLTVNAISPLRAAEKWRLPRIAPHDVPWGNASARIVVQSPLRIEQLWPSDAQIVSAVSPTTANLKYLTADAAIDVVVVWSSRDIQATAATILDVGAEARGSAVIEAVFADAAATSVTGLLDDGWSVESVASTPPEAVVDWRIDGNAQSGERLVVECRPDASRRARIVVTARWRDNPEQRPLRAGDLRIVDWRASCNVTRSLVSIASAPSYRLAVKGEHRLAPIDAGDETARRLLAGHDAQLRFDLGAATAALTVGARRAATPYRGDIDIDVHCSTTHVRETYRLRCTPQGDGLTRVVVRLAPTASEEIAWTDAIDPAAPIAARRLSDDEARAFLIEPGSEVWLISLEPSRSAAFEIVGERTRRFDGDLPMSLATLHDAEAQTGTITVRSEASAHLGIDNRRLTSIPHSSDSVAQFDDVRGTYRYVPARDVLAVDPAAVLTRRATASSDAIAYSCWLSARIHASGGVHRRAHFAIENFGRRKVTVDLGETTTRFEARVDDEIVARGRHSDVPIQIPLPAGRRFVSLTIDYSVEGEAPQWLGATSLPAPRIDVPVLRRRWTAFVPDALDVIGSERRDFPSASWTERWFGPLARAGNEPRFDPTSWRSWLGRSPQGIEKATARDATVAFIDRLGEAMATLAGEPATTWSALVTSIDRDDVFVDAAALDRAGLRPWTLLPIPPPGGRRTQAAQLLFDADLTIVTDGERFVLTSVAAANSLDRLSDPTAALDLRELGGLRLSVIWLPSAKTARASEDNAGDGLTKTLRRAGAERIVAAQEWSDTTGAFSLPWDTDADALQDRGAWRGWRRVELSADGDIATVRWINLNWVRVAAWVGFLAAAALAWWLSRRRAIVVVSLAAVAVAALLLDDGLFVFAPILSGIWWGLCVGLALAWLPRIVRSKREVADARSAAASRWKSVATAGAFLVAALWVVRSWADDAPTLDGDAAKPVATIHRVFYPVDDDQKPVGERVYVPEPLFARLERWKLDQERGPQGSIVAAASHRFQLDWNSDGTSLELRMMTVTVDAHTFDDDAIVSLPFASVADVRLDGALLDAGNYAFDDGWMQIAIAKAGVHRIEVAAAPAAMQREGRVGVDVKAVDAAKTRIEIDAPENGPEVEIVVATDKRRSSRERGAFDRPLVAGRTYRVEWTKMPARMAGENVESTERLWLDVTPGSVGFTADVAIRDANGLPGELRISIDPRLTPLAATVDGAETTWRRINGAADQLAFRLKANDAVEKRLIVKFLVQSASGVGVLRLPRWEPQVSEVRQRWLAVNIDDALEREITAGPEAQPMSVVDFVQNDDAETAPHYAYRLARGNVLWNLSTRRLASNVQFDQTVAAVAEAGRVRMVLDGDIAIRSGDVYEHVLRCGEQLKVNRVAVVEDDEDCVAFWTQSTDGSVQVFLNRRAGPNQRIRLEGHIEAPADGVVSIGETSLVDAKRSGRRLLLYRMPSVGVAVRDLTGLTESSSAASEDDLRASTVRTFVPPAGSRLLRDLVAAADGSPTATVELTPNVPRIDATSVVVVDEVQTNAWSVRAEFRGEVNEGLADDLVVDLPGDWIGDANVEPPMPTVVLDAPDGGRRLLIRPVLPLRGRFGFSVAGQIRTPESRAVPRWKLLDADEVREFVVLPTLWRGRRLGWDLSQMRRSVPYDGFALPRREGARYQTYQIAGERAAATLQAEIPSSRSLEAFVDVVATDLHDGSRAMLTTYDLLPSGVASCRVAMPAGARLLSAVLENRLVSPVREADGTWRIDLESDSLPQRLQIWTVNDGGESIESHRQCAAPRLEDALIRQTTWTVATAEESRHADDAIDDALDAALDTAAANAERLAARIDSLKRLWLAAANSSSDYNTLVAGRWELRLAAAVAESPSSASPETPSSAPENGGDPLPIGRWNYVIAGHREAASATVATVAQQFGAKPWGRMANDVVFQLPAAQARRFADQLIRDGGAMHATVVAAPPRVVERSAIFHRTLVGRRFAYRTTDDAAWTWSPPAAKPSAAPVGRWALALGVIAIAVLLLRRGGRRVLSEQWSRHPHLALAAFGVVWWLWLWPTWIGWACIAASLFLACRLTWPLPKLVGRTRPSSYS